MLESYWVGYVLIMICLLCMDSYGMGLGEGF